MKPETWRRRRLWIVVAVLAGAALIGWARFGPLPARFLDPAPHRSIVLTDRHGRVLYESLSEDQTRSHWLSPAELPTALVHATLAAEDHRFYSHIGLDPTAIVRAAWDDLRAGYLKEGGSTITQQVVKRLMSRSHTIGGKLREMLLALRLEHRLSKDDILALYLNLAPYGNGFAGAQAAAKGYFGCPAANLTPAQAAFLAGLPQRPTALDPYRRLSAAKERQRLVLHRMYSLGMLDDDAFLHARAEHLSIQERHPVFEAPHFVQHVLAELDPGESQRIHTSLDLDLQRDVEGVISARRPSLLARGIHNIAVLVLENVSGEILAWEGSGDYFDADHGGAIDGVTSPRQPGSALKPFTYALAFESGMSPATVLPDIPSHFLTAEAGILYSPRNYDGRYRGPMRAREALACSENVPAVWVLSKVGVARLLDLLRVFGFTTFDRTADYYGYGLTLGDAEVRLDEMVAAYACLGRGGISVKPVWRAGIERNPSTPAPRERRILSERTAFWIADVLSDARARSRTFGRGGVLEFPFQVAAKTGTSQGYTDNWAIGYTREITVGVWVGNFDRTALRSSSGVTGAGPIFHDVLLAAQQRVMGRLPTPADPPLVSPPPELHHVQICTLSGMKASEACPGTADEWLRADRLPPICSWHEKWRQQPVTLWPAEYRSWATARGLVSRQAAGLVAARANRDGAKGFAVENPPDGATYLIDPTLRLEYQALEFRVVCGGVPQPVTWSVDGSQAGTTRSDKGLRWPLEAGKHLLAATLPDGRRATASFVVK